MQRKYDWITHKVLDLKRHNVSWRTFKTYVTNRNSYWEATLLPCILTVSWKLDIREPISLTKYEIFLATNETINVAILLHSRFKNKRFEYMVYQKNILMEKLKKKKKIKKRTRSIHRHNEKTFFFRGKISNWNRSLRHWRSINW